MESLGYLCIIGDVLGQALAHHAPQTRPFPVAARLFDHDRLDNITLTVCSRFSKLRSCTPSPAIVNAVWDTFPGYRLRVVLSNCSWSTGELRPGGSASAASDGPTLAPGHPQ